MTRFEPTLIVHRLVVMRDTDSVYDQRFHEGVNVLRGENSSGKSTILNFIFYGLGGDLADWSETALLCTQVVLEVTFNEVVAVITRDISTSQSQPMEIFSGNYEASVKSPRSEWMRFPYRRSENVESFSQALFRYLKIPEARDESGNLTMHQVLRLLYADQLSPTDDLFRFERFDPPQMRVAVGRLLIGAFDSSLYENEGRIRAFEKEFDAVAAELRSLSIVAGSAGSALTSDWVQAERNNLNAQRLAVLEEIEAAEKEVYVSTQKEKLTLQAQKELYEKVQAIQTQLAGVAKARDNLVFARVDSDIFIDSLERKLTSLRDASATARQFSSIHFDRCPCCYAPLEALDSNSEHCQLCKSPLEEGGAKSRLAALINDAAIQIKQSRTIQGHRAREIQNLDSQIENLRLLWGTASAELSTLERLPSTEARNRLRSLHGRDGYIQRQIEDLNRKNELIERLEALSAKKQLLNEKITKLKETNELLLRQQSERIQKGYTAIADNIRTLLHNDLPREKAFQEANVIQFDFTKNRIEVDGSSYFSASSRVILKSSFFLGFFAAATQHAFFRHPRFLMLDTIEDKGMEVERSHNFQRQILRVSLQCSVDHQVIFATSMIAPELDDQKYTIGHFSTHENPTLKIMRSV